MKKSIFSVTIGIPAYNEQNTIVKLLKALSEQKEIIYKLRRVIVVSDGSTDKTVRKVKSLRDKRIRLIKNEKRMGQIYCQNKIFSLAKTDVVVLFEADSLPNSKMYLTYLLQPLTKNPKLGLIQGNRKPLPPKSFLEKILAGRRENFFTSGKSGRAFTKRVYKKLRWPNNVPEDVYAFLWCKSKRIKTFFQRKAVCRYRAIQTFEDYVKKSQVISETKEILSAYFSPNLIEKAYKSSPKSQIISLVYFLFTKPFFFFSFLVLKIAAYYSLRNRRFKYL